MKKIYQNKFFALTGQCHVLIAGQDSGKAEQVYQIIRDEVLRLDRLLNGYVAESDISRINKHAAQKAVPVSPEVFNILKLCRKYHDFTEGRFDITLRPLLNYWNDKSSNTGDMDRFEQALHAVGMKHITFYRKEKAVAFKNEHVQIDLIGFAKAYALEQINLLLRKYSIDSAFVNFGESSILTVGNHPAGDHWKVSIKNYLSPDEELHTFLVRDGAISTSGNFYIDDREKMRNHRFIIDPLTGLTVDGFKSVSVCSGSHLLAAVLSSAFMVSSNDYITSRLEEWGVFDAVTVNYASDKADIMRFNSNEP